MIIKSPSKRVSQLDLKFLDLRFMSIDQPYNSRTDPLPRLNESNVDSSKIREYHMNSKHQSIQDISPCERGSFLKMNKKSIFKADENTRDITNQNCVESILGQNIDLDTQRVLNYLSADTEAIYKQFGSKGPNCSKPTKKKHDNQHKINSQIGKQDSIDRQMRKYEQQVKNFQKENELIHHQITRIYSDKKKDKNFQVKNVRNMRVFQQNHQNDSENKNGIQHYYAQVTESYRYQSQDKEINKLKKGFFDKFKSTAEMYQDMKNERIQQKQPKQKREHKHILSECKSLRSHSNNCHIGLKHSIINKKKSPHKLSKQHNDKINEQGIKLPSLIQHKYDRFYQELYKERRDKVILTEKQKQLINEDGKSIQTLQQLKKKMINNNFDKNFEAFLQQKKIRVPQFIKNLR